MANVYPEFGFGCTLCFGEVAAAAESHRRKSVHSLIDESHFIVSIVRCEACHQQFVSIFTEFVDWVDGDDPQYRDVVPITDDEATDLVRQGAAVDLHILEALGAGRRRLVMSYPKGGARRVFWATGGLSVRRGH